jgi:transposase-like protein
MVNNRMEPDHRHVKRRPRAMQGVWYIAYGASIHSRHRSFTDVANGSNPGIDARPQINPDFY